MHTQKLNKQLLWHVWLKGNKTGSKVFRVTHQGDLLPTQLGFYCGERGVRSEGLELKGEGLTLYQLRSCSVEWL